MNRQFENLTASELYCPRCRTARPVRERLLLILPHAELYDFRCTACGESCGSREVKAPPLSAAQAMPKPSSPRPAAQTRRPPRGLLA